MHNKRQTIISLSTWAVALVFSLAVAWPLAAQDKPMKLFETGDTLKIKLHAPWRDIERKQQVRCRFSCGPLNSGRKKLDQSIHS